MRKEKRGKKKEGKWYFLGLMSDLRRIREKIGRRLEVMVNWNEIMDKWKKKVGKILV